MYEVYVEIVTVRSSVYPAEYRNIKLAMIPLRFSASTGREGVRRGSGLIEYSLYLLSGCMKGVPSIIRHRTRCSSHVSEAPCCRDAMAG